MRSAILFAQSRSNVADVHVGNYVVKLISNSDSTYGYQINQDDKIIIRQKGKPYGTSSIGFREKQNAMVIAIWQANELSEGRINQKSMDQRKARELGITKEDL